MKKRILVLSLLALLLIGCAGEVDPQPIPISVDATVTIGDQEWHVSLSGSIDPIGELPPPEPSPTPTPELPQPSPTPTATPPPVSGQWTDACIFPWGGQIYGAHEAAMYTNQHWQDCPALIGLVLWQNTINPNDPDGFMAHNWLLAHATPEMYIAPMGSNPNMLTGKYNQAFNLHPEVSHFIDGILLGPEDLPGMPPENAIIVRDSATVFVTIYLECARAHEYGVDCIFAPSWQDMANLYPGPVTQSMVDAAVNDLSHYLGIMGLDQSVMDAAAQYLQDYVGQTLTEEGVYNMIAPVVDIWLLQMAPAAFACPDPVTGIPIGPCFHDMVEIRRDWLVAANPDIRLHFQIAFPPIHNGETQAEWLDRAEWTFLSYREAVAFPESDYVWCTPAEYTMGSQYYDDAIGRMDLIHAMLTE